MSFYSPSSCKAMTRFSFKMTTVLKYYSWSRQPEPEPTIRARLRNKFKLCKNTGIKSNVVATATENSVSTKINFLRSSLWFSLWNIFKPSQSNHRDTWKVLSIDLKKYIKLTNFSHNRQGVLGRYKLSRRFHIGQ